MTSKDIGDLSVHRQKCGIGQNVCISNPRLITQFIELRGNVYMIRATFSIWNIRGSAVATIAEIS